MITEEMVMGLPVKEPNLTNQYTLYKYEDKFREILKKRIEHCENSFKANMDKAYIQDPCFPVAFWDKGHFSYPTYVNMIETLEFPINKWEPGAWVQIVRQMARMDNIDPVLFDIASECIELGKENPLIQHKVLVSNLCLNQQTQTFDSIDRDQVQKLCDDESWRHENGHRTTNPLFPLNSHIQIFSQNFGNKYTITKYSQTKNF